jgi:hypothetical protein
LHNINAFMIPVPEYRYFLSLLLDTELITVYDKAYL